jgi:hypothetical protein
MVNGGVGLIAGRPPAILFGSEPPQPAHARVLVDVVLAAHRRTGSGAG